MNLETIIIANLLGLPVPSRIRNLPDYIISNKSVFGVFVTIKRSINLGTWPENIHGCIGYWDEEYRPLSSSVIIKKLKKVSSDALNQDERKKYFPDIMNDPIAQIELDFMMLPILDVQPSSGYILNKSNKTNNASDANTNAIPYKNSEYGLIVTSQNGTRATYLPHVFPDNMSWHSLANSLKEKAGISTTHTNTKKNSYISNGNGSNKSNSKVKYHAYRVNQIKTTFWDLLKNGDYTKFLMLEYLNAILAFTLQHQTVPYTYEPHLQHHSKLSVNKLNKENGSFTVDDDVVRNLSVLESIINYSRITNFSLQDNMMLDKLFKIIKKQLKKVNIYHISDYYDIEIACYLSLILSWNSLIKFYDNASNKLSKMLLPIDTDLINIMIKRLPKADRDFARGQLLLALLKYDDKMVIPNLDEMLESMFSYDINIDAIFRMNWDSQVLVALNNSNSNSNSNPKKYGSLITKIIARYMKLLDSIEAKFIHLETNELAVAMEGFMKLINANVTGNKVRSDKIYFKCLKLFVAIMQRYDVTSKLIHFKDNTARVDITVHFLDAFIKN